MSINFAGILEKTSIFRQDAQMAERQALEFIQKNKRFFPRIS